MFNRLPPELVRQIFESSGLSTYQRNTYRDRQTLLRSLCLTCHLFREIAQPLLFDSVWIDWQWKLDALLTTLKSKPSIGVVREAVVGDCYRRFLEVGYLERMLRSSQGLRSLTIHLGYGGEKMNSDLSGLQDLSRLVNLSLFGSDYRFSSSFRLHALTRLSIDHTTVRLAPTLLDPEVLPSLRSLAMFKVYDDNEIAYLNRSRLADLVPQLESVFLNARIIQRGLDYLTPALSRTLFEFAPSSSANLIDVLQVAQHLRIHKHLNLRSVIQKFVVSIKNQHRQISLRSIYLDISLADLPSLPVDLVKAVQDLLQACNARRIQVIYEAQEVRLIGESRLSEEFCRRQRVKSMIQMRSQ